MTSRRQCSALPARYPPPPIPARHGGPGEQPPCAAQSKSNPPFHSPAAVRPSPRISPPFPGSHNATPPFQAIREGNTSNHGPWPWQPWHAVWGPAVSDAAEIRTQDVSRTVASETSTVAGATQLSFPYPCLAWAHLMQVRVLPERSLGGSTAFLGTDHSEDPLVEASDALPGGGVLRGTFLYPLAGARVGASSGGGNWMGKGLCNLARCSVITFGPFRSANGVVGSAGVVGDGQMGHGPSRHERLHPPSPCRDYADWQISSWPHHTILEASIP